MKILVWHWLFALGLLAGIFWWAIISIWNAAKYVIGG